MPGIYRRACGSGLRRAAGGAGATGRETPDHRFLSPNSAAVAGPWGSVFADRLHELGWAEGANVAIAYRWGEGRNEGAVERVAELLRLPVDIIVTHGPANIAAAKARSKAGRDPGRAADQI